MKFILILSFLLVFSPHVLANKKGIGISFGNPTGLNGKYWVDDKRAIDASLGLSLGVHSDVSMHSDYLFHHPEAFYLNEVHPLDLYYGLGGRMEFADDIELGIRFPIGISHQFKEQDADLFFETAPVLEILTKKGLELHLLFGARYYFI
jgi:hypothetical protein